MFRVNLKRLFSRVLINYLSAKKIALVKYYHPDQTAVFDLVSKIIMGSAGVTVNEASQIYRAVQATRKIQGDMAEVGVYTGSTAQVICEAKGEKPLHLFDTFEGLPVPTEKDDARQFRKGELAYNLEKVRERLKSYSNVFFYKGLFPTTSNPVKSRTFSFVNLDADLYESTKDSLTFFYPRLAKGGVLISHDYVTAKGVREAFDEFFKDKIEPVIQLADDQCMVVKY
jgi:hypothetical protein